jgi:hypothetical protein
MFDANFSNIWAISWHEHQLIRSYNFAWTVQKQGSECLEQSSHKPTYPKPRRNKTNINLMSDSVQDFFCVCLCVYFSLDAGDVWINSRGLGSWSNRNLSIKMPLHTEITSWTVQKQGSECLEQSSHKPTYPKPRRNKTRFEQVKIMKEFAWINRNFVHIWNFLCNRQPTTSNKICHFELLNVFYILTFSIHMALLPPRPYYKQCIWFV